MILMFSLDINIPINMYELHKVPCILVTHLEFIVEKGKVRNADGIKSHN